MRLVVFKSATNSAELVVNADRVNFFAANPGATEPSVVITMADGKTVVVQGTLYEVVGKLTP